MLVNTFMYFIVVNHDFKTVLGKIRSKQNKLLSIQNCCLYYIVKSKQVAGSSKSQCLYLTYKWETPSLGPTYPWTYVNLTFLHYLEKFLSSVLAQIK